MRMSVVGEGASRPAGVALVQWDLAGVAGGAARDLIRTDAPKIRAARELRASHLAERRALAARRVGRLVTDQLGVDPAGVRELHELTRILDGLQERTLRARMVPFGTIDEPLGERTRLAVAAATGSWPARRAGSRPFTLS
jgi:chemotaxis protein histidine kinase CheA